MQKSIAVYFTLTALLFAAALVSPGQAFAQLRDFKEGDVVQIKADTGRWLSWYKGNWVVTSDAEKPGTTGTWTIKSVSFTEDGNTEFRLYNHKSETCMGACQDNSVVLDDEDYPRWIIRTRAKTGLIGVDNASPLYSVYSFTWPKYRLKDKFNDAHDVVLRHEDPGAFNAGNGTATQFRFFRVK